MQRTCLVRSRPPSGGYITVGTLILAALSAVMLVLMAGCHSAPRTNAFAATASDRSAEVRLKEPDAMAHLQPFDEHFVTVEDADAP